jgi:hypothetical protein
MCPFPDRTPLAALCTAPLDPEDCLQPGRLCRRGHPVRLGHQLAARVACLDPEDTNLRLDHALARLARHRHLLPTHDPRPFMNLNTPEHWQEFLTLFPTRS